MPLPTITGNLKVPAPTFIRKLRRASDWGQSDEPINDRVASAVAKVFRNQLEPEISVYLVTTDDDLRRVAIGYNAGRKGSLHEMIAFLPILKSELEQQGIQITKKPANLKCDYANQLHYDLIASDNQLDALCRSLMNSNRDVGRCSESTMRAAEQRAADEKCKSVPGIIECGLAGCGTLASEEASNVETKAAPEQAGTAPPPAFPPGT